MNDVVLCFLGLVSLTAILLLDQSMHFKKYALTFSSLQKFGKVISLGCFILHLPQTMQCIVSLF